MLKVALGLILGLALGLVIAYMLEALNTARAAAGGPRGRCCTCLVSLSSRGSPTGRASAQSHFRRLLGSGKKTAEQTVGSPMAGNQTFSIGIEAFRNLRTA